MRPIFAVLASLVLALPAKADPVTVVKAWWDGSRFHATLSHPDTGWDHYADGWRVELGDGTVLGIRELLHPHVTEQPFTRSLSGVQIPDGVTEVFLRARCNIDGWNTDVTRIDLDNTRQP